MVLLDVLGIETNKFILLSIGTVFALAWGIFGLSQLSIFKRKKNLSNTITPPLTNPATIIPVTTPTPVTPVTTTPTTPPATTTPPAPPAPPATPRKKKKEPLVGIMVTSQGFAHIIWILTSVILYGSLYKSFTFAGGELVWDGLYKTLVIAFALPFYALYDEWQITIAPQFRGELMFRGKRLKIWLKEGIWLIPFYSPKGFYLNLTEVQKTSKKDVKVGPFPCHDIKLEGLEVQINAERIIKDDGSVYEEFDEEQMEENEKDLLMTSAINVMRLEDYFKESRKKTPNGKVKWKINLTKDPEFQSECDRFGIEFNNIIVRVQLIDMSKDNTMARWNRMCNDYIEGFKATHNGDAPDAKEMKEIYNRLDSLFGLLKRVDVKGKTNTFTGV